MTTGDDVMRDAAPTSEWNAAIEAAARVADGCDLCAKGCVPTNGHHTFDYEDIPGGIAVPCVSPSSGWNAAIEAAADDIEHEASLTSEEHCPPAVETMAFCVARIRAISKKD